MQAPRVATTHSSMQSIDRSALVHQASEFRQTATWSKPPARSCDRSPFVFFNVATLLLHPGFPLQYMKIHRLALELDRELVDKNVCRTMLAWLPGVRSVVMEMRCIRAHIWSEGLRSALSVGLPCGLAAIFTYVAVMLAPSSVG